MSDGGETFAPQSFIIFQKIRGKTLPQNFRLRRPMEPIFFVFIFLTPAKRKSLRQDLCARPESRENVSNAEFLGKLQSITETEKNTAQTTSCWSTFQVAFTGYA